MSYGPRNPQWDHYPPLRLSNGLPFRRIEDLIADMVVLSEQRKKDVEGADKSAQLAERTSDAIDERR